MIEEKLDELDETWITDFENLDNEYRNFYCEDLKFLTLNYIYLNNEAEIFKIHKEQYNLNNSGLLTKEELLHLIKKNIISDNKKYYLLSILKYNINIEPVNLRSLLTNNDLLLLGNNYLQIVRNIDDIRFEKSITFFHNLNSLFIIFNEKNNNKQLIKNSNLNIISSSFTKKIYINSNTKKKTKRKQYKENNV